MPEALASADKAATGKAPRTVCLIDPCLRAGLDATAAAGFEGVDGVTELPRP